MEEKFREILEEKKASDLKQRRITVFVVLGSLVLLAIIYVSATRQQHVNSSLQQELDTTKTVAVRADSVTNKLRDSLNDMNRQMRGVVECYGVPNGQKSRTGLTEYNFTLGIRDTGLVSRLSHVDYFFADPTYSPQIKTAHNPRDNFRLTIYNCWGCMTVVPIYLHFKSGATDTINFPMCDKAKIRLPKL
jgi:hypothetical protein